MTFVPGGGSGVPSDWGRLVVVVGGTDVSNFRNVPTQVENWGSGEPFDDNQAVIRFPQISPFEALGTGTLSWLVPFANVEILLERPNLTTKTLWEGFYASEETHHDQRGQSLTLHCMGALYQLDFIRHPPNFPVPGTEQDIGDAIWLWAWEKMITTAMRYTMGPQVATGIVVPTAGFAAHFEPSLTGWIADILARGTTSTGTNQWTVMMDRPRVFKIRLKDRTTVNWTITTGTPGMSVDVSQDHSMVPTTIWGEGEDDSGCSWRNNKHPNRSNDESLPWPGGGDITVSETSTRVNDYKQRLFDTGWLVTFGEGTDDTYDANDALQTQAFQTQNFLTATGNVNQATWDAAFFNGPDPVAFGAFSRVDPLVRLAAVEPWLYDAYGVTYGDNPAYDPHKFAIEEYLNFGRIGKARAVLSAKAILERDKDPGYIGRITLNADPEEGSRWEMHAGENILVKSFRGTGATGKLFHISEVSANHSGRSVTLSVDTKARDLMTQHALWERDRNTISLGRDPRDVKNRPASQSPSDAPAWDCESGAGIIPKMAVTGGAWVVFRIALGGTGNIQGVAAATFVPAAYSLLLFDRAITPQELQAIETGDPRSDTYFSTENFDENSGIINGWGQGQQMAGYYPGKQSEGSPKTGRLFEYQASYFVPKSPPWVWMAVWCDTSTFISGRLYPGLQKNR